MAGRCGCCIVYIARFRFRSDRRCSDCWRRSSRRNNIQLMRLCRRVLFLFASHYATRYGRCSCKSRGKSQKRCRVRGITPSHRVCVPQSISCIISVFTDNYWCLSWRANNRNRLVFVVFARHDAHLHRNAGMIGKSARAGVTPSLSRQRNRAPNFFGSLTQRRYGSKVSALQSRHSPILRNMSYVRAI